MKEEKQENGYVNPTQLDTSNVDINQANSILRQERTNIVKATIQANENIDEAKAKDVNNQIKVKKENPYLKLLVVIIVLVIAGFLCYGAYYFLVSVTKEEQVTTTTTTTSAISLTKNYFNDEEAVRRISNNQEIILLSPKGIDLKNSTSIYLKISIVDGNISNIENGNYTIDDNNVVIGNETFEYIKDGIKNDRTTYNISDSEYKYYIRSNNGENLLLMINGTPGCEVGLYIHSNLENTIIEKDKIVESMNSIQFVNGKTFVKSNDLLLIDGQSLELKQ